VRITVSSLGAEPLTLTAIGHSSQIFTVEGIALPARDASAILLDSPFVWAFAPAEHGEVIDSLVITSDAKQTVPFPSSLSAAREWIIGQAAPEAMYAASGSPTSKLYTLDTESGNGDPRRRPRNPELQSLAVHPITLAALRCSEHILIHDDLPGQQPARRRPHLATASDPNMRAWHSLPPD